MQLTKTFQIASLGGALLLLALTTSQAQTTATWIGPASGGEWNTAANWDTRSCAGTQTTNAIVGAGTNVSYNLPMSDTSFGALANNGVLNVNTNGFNCSAIVMTYPGGTGKMYVNTGGVVNVTGNFGFMSNSIVNLSAGSSVTIGGTLYIGSGTNGASSWRHSRKFGSHDQQRRFSECRWRQSEWSQRKRRQWCGQPFCHQRRHQQPGQCLCRSGERQRPGYHRLGRFGDQWRFRQSDEFADRKQCLGCDADTARRDRNQHG